MKKRAETIYSKIVVDMNKILGNKATYSDDLHTEARRQLGAKFKGVFPSDKVPKLHQLTPYAILNLDNSSQSGSHWIAVAFDNDDDELVFYDSFGRKSSRIIPSIHREYKVIDTHSDAEQRIKEDNCGQRCLAWLKLYDLLGKAAAIKI